MSEFHSRKSLLLRLLIVLFWVSEGCARRHSFPNANHIFNVIQSSMRQWGSSINHNGVSFFLATVPKAIQLYHGSPRKDPVIGMEWLAFEAEHAMNFAWSIVDCDQLNRSASSQRSIKWSFPYNVSPSEHSCGIFVDAQQVLRPLKPPPSKQPVFCLEPGYFHTYSPSRDLNLLYIDGMSAAKSKNGTLDSQEYILLHDAPKRTPFDDWFRAQNLCKIARNQWQGKVDGFVRMEHGFEIVLCDFSNLDLVNILPADHPYSIERDPYGGEPMAEHTFNFFSSITSRYFDIGGDRVKLYYEDFVTAYAYPELDLFLDDTVFPRLNTILNKTAKHVFSDLSDLIVNHQHGTAGTNWQSITTLLTSRYAHHLQLLGTPNAFPNSTALRFSIHLLVAPYISHAHRNTTLEIHRCAIAFVRSDLHSIPPKSQTLAHSTFLSVSTHLCSTLFSLLDNENLSLENQQATIRKLISWLSWPEFKYCTPSCALNEICFTAIWPWGNVEDIRQPRCKNGMEILESKGDWDMDMTPPSNPGHEDDDDDHDDDDEFFRNGPL